MHGFSIFYKSVYAGKLHSLAVLIYLVLYTYVQEVKVLSQIFIWIRTVSGTDFSLGIKSLVKGLMYLLDKKLLWISITDNQYPLDFSNLLSFSLSFYFYISDKKFYGLLFFFHSNDHKEKDPDKASLAYFELDPSEASTIERNNIFRTGWWETLYSEYIVFPNLLHAFFCESILKNHVKTLRLISALFISYSITEIKD